MIILKGGKKMGKCGCYFEDYDRPECWGTKERDVCSCGGDKTKCNFYPDIKEKALRELKGIVTNADRIRNMTDEELAKFIDLESPSCNEFCDDFGNGCYVKCKHNKGRDIILKWLKTQVEE